MKTKLAIFDVDGTLFDGNLGIEYLKQLVQNKLFPEEISSQILALYSKYKNGEVEKSLAVDEIYRLYALGMKGVLESSAKDIAKLTFENTKNKTFEFVPKLMNMVNSQGYKILLISGSPVEMIELFGKEFSIPAERIFAGSLLVETQNPLIDSVQVTASSASSFYTGEIVSYPGSSEMKLQILNNYISTNNLDVDWNESIAMGDDERDFLVLKAVGKPVAFEPSSGLKSLAIENGFEILDRDSILEYFGKILI